MARSSFRKRYCGSPGTVAHLACLSHRSNAAHAPAMVQWSIGPEVNSFMRWLAPVCSDPQPRLDSAAVASVGADEGGVSESKTGQVAHSPDIAATRAAYATHSLKNDPTAAAHRLRPVVAAVSRCLRRDMVVELASVGRESIVRTALVRAIDGLLELPEAERVRCAAPTDLVRGGWRGGWCRCTTLT